MKYQVQPDSSSSSKKPDASWLPSSKITTSQILHKKPFPPHCLARLSSFAEASTNYKLDFESPAARTTALLIVCLQIFCSASLILKAVSEFFSLVINIHHSCCTSGVHLSGNSLAAVFPVLLSSGSLGALLSRSHCLHLLHVNKIFISLQLFVAQRCQPGPPDK